MRVKNGLRWRGLELTGLPVGSACRTVLEPVLGALLTLGLILTLSIR